MKQKGNPCFYMHADASGHEEKTKRLNDAASSTARRQRRSGTDLTGRDEIQEDPEFS